MSKMIEIRSVPDAVHAKLQTRAALAGMSLSDYLVGELACLTDHFSTAELGQQLNALEPVPVSESAANVLRYERNLR